MALGSPEGPHHIVSVLGRDKGYTVKYNPLPEGVPKSSSQVVIRTIYYFNNQ